MFLDRFRMTDHVAIVTGGSRGIGRAICLAFADAGADVVIAARGLADCEALPARSAPAVAAPWPSPRT